MRFAKYHAIVSSEQLIPQGQLQRKRRLRNHLPQGEKRTLHEESNDATNAKRAATKAKAAAKVIVAPIPKGKAKAKAKSS